LHTSLPAELRRRRLAGAARKTAGLLLALFAAGAAAEDAGQPSETWYSIEISGQPAGWAMESEELVGDEVVTESKMRLEVSRGAAVATIEVASRFVETRDGRAVSVRTSQKLGAAPLESTYEFRRDGVRVRHRQGSGEEREEVLALPEGEWLTPGAVRRRIRRELARGAEKISFRSLDPMLGLEPVTTEWALEKPDQEVLTTAGVHRTALWRQTQSYAPQVATLAHVDGDGRVIRSETKLMGLKMTLTLADRGQVLGAPTAAPEILVRSFVRPDRRIARPREARRAVYEVSSGGALLPELPSAGAQLAESLGTKARVTVEPGSGPPAGGVDRAEHLRSTPYLAHDHPLLRELVVQALGRERRQGREPSTEDAERARALRSFVAGYVVDKDLDTVLGTAAEVAAARSGDCTEHSVLLAALLRAADIPSRVVSGLVYVERFAGESDIFAFHMWTQALVDGRWLDLDATLPADETSTDTSPAASRPFDAAHIALAVSSFDGGQSVLRDMARILPLMGDLDVRVLEVGYP
jgi:hypothetical protein